MTNEVKAAGIAVAEKETKNALRTELRKIGKMVAEEKASPDDILRVARLAEKQGEAETGRTLRVKAYEDAKSNAMALASAWYVIGDGRSVPFLRIAELAEKAKEAAQKGDVQTAENIFSETLRIDEKARKENLAV